MKDKLSVIDIEETQEPPEQSAEFREFTANMRTVARIVADISWGSRHVATAHEAAAYFDRLHAGTTPQINRLPLQFKSISQ